MSLTNNVIVPSLLSLVCGGIAFATLTGRHLPLVSSPRAALIVLLVIGVYMCTAGIGQVGASGRWTSPLAISGYLMGLAILVVIIGSFLGWKLPLVQNETKAVLMVVGLMLAKYVIGTAGYFFHWL